jgi:hypothetical protein
LKEYPHITEWARQAGQVLRENPRSVVNILPPQMTDTIDAYWGLQGTEMPHDVTILTQSDPNVNYVSRVLDFQLPKDGESHVTIWGISNSGKTVFFAMLIYALLNRGGKNLWEAFSMVEAEAYRWENIFLNMLQNGIFPPATEMGNHSFLNLRLQKRDNESAQVLQVTFMNAPGELFAYPDKYADSFGIINPIDYLRVCKGIIFCVDPISAIDMGDHDLLKPLIDCIMRLSQDEKGNMGIINKPIIFCMTKCDYPSFRYLLRPQITSEEVEKAAHDIFGDRLMGVIRTYIPRAKWFACSALGFEENQPINIMNRWNGEMGIRNPNQIRPINVIESFEYLLDEIIPNLIEISTELPSINAINALASEYQTIVRRDLPKYRLPPPSLMNGGTAKTIQEHLQTKTLIISRSWSELVNVLEAIENQNAIPPDQKISLTEGLIQYMGEQYGIRKIQAFSVVREIYRLKVLYDVAMREYLRLLKSEFPREYLAQLLTNTVIRNEIIKRKPYLTGERLEFLEQLESEFGV